MPGRVIYKTFFIFSFKHPIKLHSKKTTVGNSTVLEIPHKIEVLELMNQGKRVVLGLPSVARRTGIVMEGEMLFAFKNSLLNFGIDPLVVDTATHSNNPEISQKRIMTAMQDFEAELLVIQGDSMLSDTLFSEPFVRQIREKGIAIVVDLVDCFVSRNGQRVVDFYVERADFLICHNSRLLLNGRFDENFLLWPSLPYPESYFFERHVSRKSIDLLIPGSEHRGRNYYVEHARKYNLPLKDGLFSKSDTSATSFSYSDYVNSLCSAKLLFTNGYKNRFESQVIGRVTESLLAKSTLLYESGSDIEAFLVPYEDFVPVSNLNDFEEKVRFLLDNPVVAEHISTRGLKTMTEKYSTKHFWEYVFRKVT